VKTTQREKIEQKRNRGGKKKQWEKKKGNYEGAGSDWHGGLRSPIGTQKKGGGKEREGLGKKKL